MRHQPERTIRSAPRALLTRLGMRLGTTRLGLMKLGTMRRLKSRNGVAALEFALLAPIMVATAGGLYDLTTAFIAWKRVAMAAQAIDEMATSMAATATATNQLNVSQAAVASSAVYAYLPNILSAAAPAFGVTLSSIAMVPTVAGCTIGCSYTAHVAWSGVFQGSASKRPCDARAGVSALSFVPDGSNPTANTLPTDIQSAAAPLLVVDVNYTFRPVFFMYLTSSIQMTQSAYLSPRTGLASDWVHYFSAGPPDATTLCPNYPAAPSAT
jgi:Flp pilus assembly protein TadG